MTLLQKAYLPSSIAQPTAKLLCALSVVLITSCSSGSNNDPAADDGGITSGGMTSGGNSDSGNSDGGITGGLTALPNPPLTDAPSADDEPVPEPANFHTAAGMVIVADPGARIPQPVVVDLTEADFAEGPPPPVVSVPDDVDPATNTPPDFENLTNVEIVAGEILEVIYKPIDADGTRPGMFANELAPGASFDDNFDGTKTFRWQPLQNDVGINEFSVTAIDELNRLYRTTRTIRIKVTLPDDTSTIPNVAPILQEFVPHTVRVNDAVVLELKGIDYNGTVPTLELISDLPKASLVQHPRYEEVYILQFTPDIAGALDISILARDSVDSTLTSVNSVMLSVLDESAFPRPGQRLRELAAARNIQIGYASLPFYYHRPDGAIYADTAAAEFDIVTPESTMKMSLLNPLPGRYEFADVDNLVRFAEQNDIAVHGHTLVWYREVPDWIFEVDPSTLRGHMVEYIDRVMTRYKDSVAVWDVVNEAIGDNGGYRSSVWYDAIGESYIDIAFKQARELAPNATLLLNDFNIAVDGPKTESMFAVVDGMITRDVPIDGVGFQLHVFSTFNQFDEMRQIFQRVADRDLDIYITELDVSIVDATDLQNQAAAYKTIVEICLEQPRCKAIQTWGFTDQYSFREIYNPLLFDKDYQVKPAYLAIQEALSGQ